ncbi:MAG: ATPase, T2SS/T4P/T4SS family [Granulosicoccus sp.]
MFDFHFQSGSSRRKLFQVKGSHCSIGSARGNDLVIDARRIAKRHAELREEIDGIYLKDLGSLGGCRVNGTRIVDHGPLSEFDEIEIGDVRVTIRPDERQASARIRLTQAPAGEAVSSGYLSNADSTQSMSTLAVSPITPSLIPQANARHMDTAPGSPSDAAGSAITPSGSPEASQNGTTAIALHKEDTLPGHDKTMSYWCGVVHEQLLLQMDLRRKDVNRMSDEQLRVESAQIIEEITNSLASQTPQDLDITLLHQNVLNEAVGLGPLELFLADESITEIMVNNHQEIFVEKQGKLVRSPMQFSSDATVYAVIDRIITPLGRRIDESSPIVDARLKDGSRVNAVIPPLALKGPSLTIRKFPRHRMRFSELVRFGTLSEAMVSFLRVCVERRKNIIVSGGTGSGKTTLLNVLSGFIPDADRIVTIEDAAELSLGQPNLVALESRPANLDDKGEVPIRDLVKNALRMRPDRIVVGECRGGEALDMLQAMNTGHDGSLTTIHANTPRDVISRLEVLVLMAGMDLPVAAIREQVSAAVDVIIQQHRFTCGSRKITRITEVVGMESGTVQLQDIFRYEQRGVDEHHRVLGEFVPTGSVPQFYETLREFGVELDLTFFADKTLTTGVSGAGW